MATASKVVDELFALPKNYDSTSAMNGPGTRRQARLARKAELTKQLGSAAANTQLYNESKEEADVVLARISPKVEEMATEKATLEATLKELQAPAKLGTEASTTTATTTPSPLAKAIFMSGGSDTPYAQALGQAREAEYYQNSADALEQRAKWWGLLLVILIGIIGLIHSWYHRYRKLPLIVMFIVLGLAAYYPVYTMKIPGAAISPLMRLI